jgi:hypothetical protein
MNNDELKELDHLITQIMAEAEDDDGQLWVLRRVVRENLKRLEHPDEALQVFNRLLWLSPSDNLGARFLIEPIQAGEKWKADL